jgi:glycosyltransferase involved in cell wall biosynthesis
MLIKDGKRFYPETAKPIALGFAYHAENTSKAMMKYGASFITNKTPDIILHQAPAHTVERIDGAPNVLYTAYESPDLPPEYIEKASQMDLIICVSNFVTKSFRRALGKKIPILTCALGVDPVLFEFKKRKLMEGHPFVFLWNGAPNFRKGWDLVKEAWTKGGFSDDPNYILYVKTSGRDKVENYGNVIMDSRQLPFENMPEIYHSAHCFLFPSYSEGFGLTLAEAMSTGMPCVYTPWGGVNDFIDKKTGYYLRYKIVSVNYSIKTTAAEADIDDLISKMKMIKNDYHKAMVKGKNAARKIRDSFTWDHTGKTMMDILKNFLKYGR